MGKKSVFPRDSGNVCTAELKNKAKLNSRTCQNAAIEERDFKVHTHMHTHKFSPLENRSAQAYRLPSLLPGEKQTEAY